MRKICLLAIIGFFTMQGMAQSSLRFVTTQYQYTISVDSSNQTLTLQDTLRNESSTPFSGTVLFQAQYNNAPQVTLDSAFYNSLDTAGSGHSDTAVRFVLPIGGNPALMSGPNTLVIWPIYNARSGPDTIRVGLDITHIAGIDEAPLAKAYIIQHDGMLNINMGDNQNLVKQVSLYNIQGQQIYSGSAREAQNISIGNWNEGIYFCEITTYKGERRAIKFILRQQP